MKKSMISLLLFSSLSMNLLAASKEKNPLLSQKEFARLLDQAENYCDSLASRANVFGSRLMEDRMNSQNLNQNQKAAIKDKASKLFELSKLVQTYCDSQI